MIRTRPSSSSFCMLCVLCICIDIGYTNPHILSNIWIYNTHIGLFLPPLGPEPRDVGVVDIAPAYSGVGRVGPRLGRVGYGIYGGVVTEHKIILAPRSGHIAKFCRYSTARTIRIIL